MKLFLAPALVLFTLPLCANDFAAAEATAADHGRTALGATEAAINEADLRRYVTRLASEEYEGRGTGDRGERMATSYLAAFFEGLGLRAEGDDGRYFQNFEFRAGMELRGENSLTLRVDEPVGLVRRFEPGDHYQPVSLSTSGNAEGGVVFAGFGIEADGYNSFEGIEVEGNWLLVLRGSPKGREDLRRFGPLVAKANLAKKKGAAGIIFVKGTNPAISTELVPPTTSVGGREAVLPAITITDRLAAAMLTGQRETDRLKEIFEAFNSEERMAGHPLPWRIGAEIGIEVNRDPGRNVLARLGAGDEPSEDAIVIGAHIDHLGYGNRGGTRAKGEDAQKIHFGADDNASGVAAVMELAQFFAQQKKEGKLDLRRDLVFAAWSGEEVGLWGSRHYVSEAKKAGNDAVYPRVTAYLNLDMVGRAGENGLTIHGTASSGDWKEILDSVGNLPGLKVKRTASPFLPTDTAPFYQAGVPVLAAFTGLHDDYHTPADTVDKIDFEGLGLVSRYLRELAVALAQRAEAPGYVEVERGGRERSAPKVRLGLMPEDAEAGVRVAQVSDGSPAARAGLQEGDVITMLDGKDVEKIDALFTVLGNLEPENEYALSVKRGEESVELKITPEAR